MSRSAYLFRVCAGSRARGAALRRGEPARHQSGAGRGVDRAAGASSAHARTRHRAGRRGVPRLRLLQAEQDQI